MSLSVRSSSNNFHDNERVTRGRRSTKLNRFLSFNENQSASTENRRRSFQSTPNLIELLEEDEDEIDEYEVLSYECNSCSKTFASEYGLNHHTNMHHPNQSVLCSICNLTFRSHRSLKTHQQRRHSAHQTVKNHGKTEPNEILPDYSYVSSYLVLAFSSCQFPVVAKKACEEKRFPLGTFASRLYQCHFCQISFPCSRTLRFHLLDQHEHFEYDLCENLLNEIILSVEENSRTVDNHQEISNENDFQSISIEFAKQASFFGLQNKKLAQNSRLRKVEQNRLIFPSCPHQQRTCANLCLNQLSSYNKLIQNYNYSILTLPKGNPHGQGSIISYLSLSLTKPTVHANNNAISNTTNEITNGRHKRRSFPQANGSTSNGAKRKSITNSSSTNNKTNRSHTIKSETDLINKMNEQSHIPSTNNAHKKSSTKDNSTTSLSNSSSSTTSPSTNGSNINASTSKSRAAKRTLINTEPISSKRIRTRAQTSSKNGHQPPHSKTVIQSNDFKHENHVEQENRNESDSDQQDHSDSESNDDDGDDDDDDKDVIPIRNHRKTTTRTSKQRKDSHESVEYIPIVDDDDSKSLNNIENVKSKTKKSQQDRLHCGSVSPVQKFISSSNKTHSKTNVNGNNNRKTKNSQSPKDEENIRVRCKVCGAILKGRRRFSEHVIEMHGHLLMKKATVKEQTSQPTAVIR